MCFEAGALAAPRSSLGPCGEGCVGVTVQMWPCMQKRDEEMANESTVRSGVKPGMVCGRGSQAVMSLP